MFGQISLDCKLDPTKVTTIISPALVMSGLFMVFQSVSVTKNSWTQRTSQDMSSMSGPLMSVEAGLSGKLRITLSAFEGLFSVVCFDVSS